MTSLLRGSTAAPAAPALGEAPPRGGWSGLIAAAALFLVLRAAILVTNFDATALWAYELYMCGTIGRALLGGGGDLPLPYYYDNAAGPVLMGFVAAPFYAVLGPSYLSLKLVSLTLNLLALVLAWLVLRRLFGLRTANVAAFLLALAPATSTKYALIAAGNHSENLCFTMLATWAFVQLHSRPERRAWLVATGASAGWALAIFVGALVPMALLALAHIGLRGLKRALRDLPWAVAGFALGLAPLVWLNLGSGGRGVAFVAAKFGGPGTGFDAAKFARRIGEFLGPDLLACTTYPRFLGLPGRIADAAFLAATAAAFALCAPIAWRTLREFWRRRGARDDAPRDALARALVFCWVAYLPLAALAYGQSNLKIAEYVSPVGADGYRYYLPHLFGAMLLIAIASGVLRASPRPASTRWATALAALPLAAGVFDFGLVRPSASARNVGAHYEGHNFAQNARTLLSGSLELSIESAVAHAESFAPPFRARVYHGLGYYRAFDRAVKPKAPPIDLDEIVAPFAPERRADVARGIGTLFRFAPSAPGRLRGEHEALLVDWCRAQRPYAERAAEGALLEWGMVTWSRTQEFLNADLALVQSAPPELRKPFARGFGLACGRILRRGIEGDSERVSPLAAQLDADLRASFDDGLGAGLADGFERPALPAVALSWIDESRIDAVLAGFHAGVREIWGDEQPFDANELERDLPEPWRERWRRLAWH